MNEPAVVEELTREKNLIQVYSVCRRLHSGAITWLIAATSLLLLGSIWAIGWHWGAFGPDLLARSIGKMAEYGFSFTVSILGFLLAGFTVLATLGKPDLFKEMALVEYKSSGISYLKYTFCMFIRVMIHYFAVAVLCAGILFYSPFFNDIILVLYEEEYVMTTKWSVYGVAFCFLGTFLLHLFFILQSFIFNIYHIVMTSIRWDFESEPPSSESRQS